MGQPHKLSGNVIYELICNSFMKHLRNNDQLMWFDTRICFKRNFNDDIAQCEMIVVNYVWVLAK